ncbi:alkene reductase [Chryseobacterium gotjawalense]|uniref:Alkene reductase n=1 Tax=Chryseobacterium gotjawalense TaxID=3042315 RepID=A0ABY8RDC1_9FLAO|nr:alkene reductase [Chryseobacterium sp. wdc7]WHF51831.1 alkene reductase [Chryseobacterium sp. wdc7]
MNSLETLFSPYQLGSLTLQNRIVMAPMTRSRAIGNIPNDLMAQYYGSRASAGLIITEGTSPSPNGLGYARIPGMYSDEQIKGWKKVTDAVHQSGGKIFVQLMHTGRISHPLNMPEGAEVIGASPIAVANTPMYTDQEAMQPLPVPKEVAAGEIPSIIAEFVHAAKSAVAAGFDGVELHAANGYLLEQFLNTASNKRTDEYGGSIENRNRLVLEVTEAVANAIGKDKTGIRLSPFGAFGEMLPDEATEEQYAQLAAGLKAIGIVYIHVVDHSSMGTPAVPQSVKDAVRKEFGGTIILSGGYDAVRAEADLKAGKGELVAFARPFIANPDLVKKFAAGGEPASPDPDTFYTPGEKGYTDYPVSAN